MQTALFPSLSRFTVALRVGGFYAAVTLLSVAWSTFARDKSILLFEPAGSRLLPSNVLSNLALGCAFGLLLVLLTRWAKERFQFAQVLHGEFKHLIGPIDRHDILVIAAASAIGEECLFRGALMPQISQYFSQPVGVVVAVLFSSLLFSLLHIGPDTRFVAWTISSFVFGLILGCMFLMTGDLLASIAIHFTVNGLNLADIVKNDQAQGRSVTTSLAGNKTGAWTDPRQFLARRAGRDLFSA